MTSSMALAAGPNPAVIWEHINAYQRTACLRGAVELELFTHIAEGAQTVEALAKACGASERGVRVLCDYLTIQGLLTKAGNRYGLTEESAAFLDKRSPAYLGGTLAFINSPGLVAGFDNIAEVVRRGTTIQSGAGVVDAEDPVWLDFAKAMPALIRPAAEFIAELAAGNGPQRVLDIAAGHGLFGIGIARANPQAQITPVDWSGVLDIAKSNAADAGVADRYHPIAGDAFQVDFETGYDTVLLTNFLHHFDRTTCVGLLRKIRASLAPGGRLFTLEFVPNEDRISPPPAAAFSLMMLCITPAGDAYTFDELRSMLTTAGFGNNELMAIPKSPESVIVSS